MYIQVCFYISFLVLCFAFTQFLMCSHIVYMSQLTVIYQGSCVKWFYHKNDKIDLHLPLCKLKFPSFNKNWYEPLHIVCQNVKGRVLVVDVIRLLDPVVKYCSTTVSKGNGFLFKIARVLRKPLLKIQCSRNLERGKNITSVTTGLNSDQPVGGVELAQTCCSPLKL